MKRTLSTLVAMSAIIMSGCGGISSQPPDDPFTKTICDFNAESELGKWCTKDGCEVALATADGRTILVMKLPRSQKGTEVWPGAIRQFHAPVDTDWSGYDALQFESRVKRGGAADLGVLVTGAGKGKFFVKQAVLPGEWQLFRCALNSAKLDLAKIDGVNLYVTMPSDDYEIDVTTIKLVSDLPAELSKLAKDFVRIGNDAKATRINETLAKAAERKISIKELAALKLKWHQELRRSQLAFYRQASEKLLPGKDISVLAAASVDKVMPLDLPNALDVVERLSVSLARNEHESVQAVIVSPQDKPLKNLKAEISPLRHQQDAGATLPEGAATISPVGFVKTSTSREAIPYYGWYPDPILEHVPQLDVEPDAVQPFWVRVRTESTTRPGLYHGTIRFSAADAVETTIPIIVKVWDFQLPKQLSLRFVTSVYTSPLLPERDSVYNYLLTYRLNPFSIYTGNAYGKPESFPVDAYTSRLDKGLNFIPVLYLKLPRQCASGLSPEQSKAKWRDTPEEEQRRYPMSEKNAVMAYLDNQVPQLKAAGLWDIAYCYGFDEAVPSEWPAIVDLCAAIHAKYPDLRIISTAYDSSYGTNSVLGGALNGWIPHYDMYDPSTAVKARKTGRTVWRYSTTFLVDRDSPASIRRVMGEENFKFGVDGFLYWTVTRWNDSNQSPISKAPFTDWNPETFKGDNGGGSFFCAAPGKRILPTIRAEAIRDGIEDYEYWTMLRRQVEARPLDADVKKEAEALLNQPPTTTHDGKQLLERREKVGALLEKLATEAK